MRLDLLIDHILFMTLYSCFPFYVLELFQGQINSFFYLEEFYHIKDRFIILHLLASLAFVYFQKSGFRTRYVIWHLEKKRTASGFNPLELAFLTFYQTILLGLTTESILAFIDPPKIPRFWLAYTGNRLSNIFLLSILEHMLLELSRINDRFRLTYFDRDHL
jgi:hypothetical protein